MDLKELLGEELYKQVSEKLGDKKLMIDDGNFIPKSRFDEVNNQKKELKEQVDTLNKTLQTNSKDFEKFKKAAEGNEELQKQLQEYQDKFNNTQKEFTTQLTAKEQEWKQRDINNTKKLKAIEKIYSKYPKKEYMEEIDWHLSKNLDKITMNEDGTCNGLDDVVENIYKTKPDLFGKVQVVGTGISGGANASQNSNLQALAEKAKSGLPQDRMAYIKAKQELNQEE